MRLNSAFKNTLITGAVTIGIRTISIVRAITMVAGIDLDFPRIKHGSHFVRDVRKEGRNETLGALYCLRHEGHLEQFQRGALTFNFFGSPPTLF